MTSQTLPPVHTAPATMAPVPGRSARAASWALGFSLLALVGGIATMAAVGASMVPMETASGYYLTDTPAWYQVAVLAAFGSLLLWTVAGLAGIVLAVLGLRAGTGRARSIFAIVLAVLAPFLTLSALMVTLGAGVATL